MMQLGPIPLSLESHDPSPPARPSLAEARRWLSPPARDQSAAPLLGAAALLAVSAFVLAGALILGPFWEISNPSSPGAAAPEVQAQPPAAPASPPLPAPPPPRMTR